MNDFENYDDLPELDFDNIEEDPILGPFLEMVRVEADRKKKFAINKNSFIKVFKVVYAIKTLLDRDKTEDEYTIEVEHFECFPEDISIKIETEDFGASQNDYWIFSNIVNMADSFSSEALSETRVRYYFGIKDVYREVPQE